MEVNKMKYKKNEDFENVLKIIEMIQTLKQRYKEEINELDLKPLIEYYMKDDSWVKFPKENPKFILPRNCIINKNIWVHINKINSLCRPDISTKRVESSFKALLRGVLQEDGCQPVDLIKFKDEYHVMNGNHRTAAQILFKDVLQINFIRANVYDYDNF